MNPNEVHPRKYYPPKATPERRIHSFGLKVRDIPSSVDVRSTEYLPRYCPSTRKQPNTDIQPVLSTLGTSGLWSQGWQDTRRVGSPPCTELNLGPDTRLPAA